MIVMVLCYLCSVIFKIFVCLRFLLFFVSHISFAGFRNINYELRFFTSEITIIPYIIKIH